MIENMFLDDSWMAVDLLSEHALPVLLRLRPNLQNFIEAGLHTQRMDIIWTYETTNDSLLPELADMDLMEQVENALVHVFEQDNQTILSFVFTGENERWWSWYTADINIAGDRLNDALAEFDKLPITLSVTDDPDWSEYLSVIADFVEEE